MPVRRSSLVADRRSLKIDFGDETLTLVYKPSSVNARQEAREVEDRAAGRAVLSQARSLVEMILSWDMLDDDGQPLPITEEVMGDFGLDVTNKLMNAILDDLLPNRVRRTDSPSGSTPAASSGAAPSGTATSSPPTAPTSPSGS